MRLQSLLLAGILACNGLPAVADLISPQSVDAVRRLQANPQAFDRVDNFCLGKKPGAACSIPGTTFEGGGAGICRNDVARGASTIDMTCVRPAEVLIDRKLPCHPVREAMPDGTINPPPLSEYSEYCEPMVPIPADRFCRDKPIDSACTVELTYQGKSERHEGVCRQTSEIVGSPHPHHDLRREVITCEPRATVTRSYSSVPWWRKIFQ